MGYHAVLGADSTIGRATLDASRGKGHEGKPLARADADAMVPSTLIKILAGV